MPRSIVRELENPLCSDKTRVPQKTKQNNTHTHTQKKTHVSDRVRVEKIRRRLEGIDGRVHTNVRNLTGQHSRRVKMLEGGRRGGIGDIIGRHIDGLDRGNRSLHGTLLELTYTDELQNYYFEAKSQLCHGQKARWSVPRSYRTKRSLLKMKTSAVLIACSDVCGTLRLALCGVRETIC